MELIFEHLSNKFRTVLLPVCTKPLNEGCDELRDLDVAKLYQRVAERFLSDHPNDFCENGIKIIFSAGRRRGSEGVSFRVILT